MIYAILCPCGGWEKPW